VNVLLEVVVAGAFVTGVTSWAVGSGWNRWFTVAHAVCGIVVLVLAPAKMRRSVKTGLKRRRATRWLSIVFGLLIFLVAGLGLLHSTGTRYGEGYWAPLWSHFLFAFVALPLFIWHVASRPTRVRAVDLDRRFLLRGGVAFTTAAAIVGATEVAARGTGLAGGRRRYTGSHEIGSFDPDLMPAVIWINDHAPDTPDGGWPLRIDDKPVNVADLATRTKPVLARIDCTGGWYADQRWDAVPISEVLPNSNARSFRVTSSTGYQRLLPMHEADNIYLAVGYDGRPLRSGHGAPVRLIVPGRRATWWVKWVVSVTPDDRPWWQQLPFPLD
jgi:Oxidoreductase molybdopterin binding domain